MAALSGRETCLSQSQPLDHINTFNWLRKRAKRGSWAEVRQGKRGMEQGEHRCVCVCVLGEVSKHVIFPLNSREQPLTTLFFHPFPFFYRRLTHHSYV